MKMLIKVLTNGRVMSAVISAVGAIISAICAGCRLACGEMTIKEFEAEIIMPYMTNSVNNIGE